MSHTSILRITVVIALAVPSVFVRFGHVAIGPGWSVTIYGAAIVASAFLLTWAAETAQLDISASLAIAILALIAVLPEYAVDLYFAFTAGHRPEYAQFAAANMTGSNRLLIGIGWPLAAIVFAWGAYRRGHRSHGLSLEPRRGIELTFLAAASAYAFLVPLFKRISLIDSAVLLTLFVAYGWRVSKEERSEPELVGMAASLGKLPKRGRRILVAFLFCLAAAFILSAAEPFADSLVNSGKMLGIDEFLLVQWLAPLASEAPELIVAVVMAWRGHADGALGTLLSSKVNQWTLLVGSLPLAHAIGGGGWALGLDARQSEEFFLTAAQTVLGLAVLINLRLEVWEATALLLLFSFQFPFNQQTPRLVFAAAYILLALVILVGRRKSIPFLLQSFTGKERAG